MKLMNPPKTRFLLLASLLFLLLPFGLVNKLGLTQFEVKVPKNGVLIGRSPINTPFFGLLKLQLRNSYEYYLQSEQDQPAEIYVPQSIPDTFSAEIFQAQREPAQFDMLLQGSFSQDVGFESDAIDGLSNRAIGGSVTDLSESNALDMSSDSSFESFVLEVKNGDSETITGVYVAGLFSLKVLQQLPEDVAFVSNENGTATQFQSSAHFGVVGLLAHNYLSGRHFLSLSPGHEIRLVFGDGSYRRYQVIGIADFERLTRFDVRSDFRDLQTQKILTYIEVFDRFYRGDNYLTLQTCLEGDGYLNWGIRMVSAMPIDPES